MATMDIECPHCESEFYIETEFDVLFCTTCGDSLPQGEWNDYRDVEYSQYEDD